MLELLLGGAGSGKTYTVFEELTRLAEQEAPPALFLLVPSSFPLKAKGRCFGGWGRSTPPVFRC